MSILLFCQASEHSRRPQEACPDHGAGPPWPEGDLSSPQGLADHAPSQTWGPVGRGGLRAWLAPSGFHGRFKDQNGTSSPTRHRDSHIGPNIRTGSRLSECIHSLQTHTSTVSHQHSHSHRDLTLIT